MKVGLVLEGGAMRGMFTAGVLDVFLDEQIHIDGIVSVSAGALFGVNFPSKQKGRVLRYNKKYLKTTPIKKNPTKNNATLHPRPKTLPRIKKFPPIPW